MVTFATFDVLDKELTREVATFAGYPDDIRWNNSAITFQVDPQYWKDYYGKVAKHLPKIKWGKFQYSKFTDLNKKIKTDDIGIYLFVLKPDDLIFEWPQFVMYVGIAGEGGSKRPLRTRLSDYLNIAKIKKRKKLHSMLSKYYHNTWVYYSTLKGMKHTDLEQLEEDLHGFFIPPANDRDYPVRLKNIIKAQFTR